MESLSFLVMFAVALVPGSLLGVGLHLFGNGKLANVSGLKFLESWVSKKV